MLTTHTAHLSPSHTLTGFGSVPSKRDASLDLPALSRIASAPVPAAQSVDQTFSCRSLLARLELLYPEWTDQFELIDADLSNWAGLARCADDAPHEFLRGMANGKLTERISMSMITGRRPNGWTGYTQSWGARSDMIDAEQGNEAWFDDLSHALGDVNTPSETLLALADSAPTDYLSGTVYGQMLVRIDMRALTGRTAGG